MKPLLRQGFWALMPRNLAAGQSTLLRASVPTAVCGGNGLARGVNTRDGQNPHNAAKQPTMSYHILGGSARGWAIQEVQRVGDRLR